MRENKKQTDIEILNFSPEFRTSFEQLNRDWIERYFAMETLDYLLLQNPEKEIIEKGGAILFAALAGSSEIVGTVALKSEDNGVFELAKMAVDGKAQGRGIGKVLGTAALERAREMGARKVVLYTNSVLQPAINLYRKLGFREIPVTETGYTRADIKMEIEFKEDSKCA